MLVATLLGRVAAELTAQDGLLLYCGAFAAQVTARSRAPARSLTPAPRIVAWPAPAAAPQACAFRVTFRSPARALQAWQVLQGIAHDVTGQKATLLQLQDNTQKERALTLGCEWSHTLYFPNLLLNSIYESLTGQKDSVLLSGEAEEGAAQADGTEKALTESKDKDA